MLNEENIQIPSWKTFRIEGIVAWTVHVPAEFMNIQEVLEQKKGTTSDGEAFHEDGSVLKVMDHFGHTRYGP